MEKGSISIQDALEITLGILEDIPVKVRDTETIGGPLATAVGNLRAVIQAIREQQKPAEPEPAAEEQEAEDVQQG